MDQYEWAKGRIAESVDITMQSIANKSIELELPMPTESAMIAYRMVAEIAARRMLLTLSRNCELRVPVK